MSATATILIDKKENVLTIPAESLVTNNGKDMVRVLEKGQVMLKPVQTGLNNGTWVEIIEGLNENDQIIVAQTSTDNSTLQMMPGGLGGMGGRPPTGSAPPNNTQRRNN
jgi:multidrug efflux pump subunit AcrA (membrane-fusion protein)